MRSLTLHCAPARDLAPGEFPGQWLATGPDPWFSIADLDAPLAPGWYRLSMRMRRAPKHGLARLRLLPVPDNQDSFVMEISLPFTPAGRLDHVVHLPMAVSSIELQPFPGLGAVSMPDARLRIRPLRWGVHLVPMLLSLANELLSGRGLRGLQRFGPFASAPDVTLTPARNRLEDIYLRAQRRRARPAVPLGEYALWARAREQAWTAGPTTSTPDVCFIVDAQAPCTEADLTATLDSLRAPDTPDTPDMPDAASSPLVRAVLLTDEAASDLAAGRSWLTQLRTAEESAAVRLRLALERVNAAYLWLLLPGERIHPQWGRFLSPALTGSPACVFGDEDEVDASGLRCNPLLKPGWDPFLALGCNLMGPATLHAVETVLAMRLDATRPETLRLEMALAAAASGRPVHVPQVLLHLPQGRGVAGRPPDAEAMHLLERFAPRILPDCSLRLEQSGPCVRLRPQLPHPPPKVSVIIPTRDGIRHLAPCLRGLLEGTACPGLEIIVLDNGSRDPATLEHLRALAARGAIRLIPADFPFNYSRLNNLGAEQAQGEVLVFCNDDIEVLEPGWLTEMAAWAMQPGIGAVGALLLYPSGLIQHAGVVPGMHGTAGHVFRHMRPDSVPWPHVLHCPRRVGAVTAACLAVQRSLHVAVGGFDERFAVAYGDVGYCLKIAARGRANLFTPLARLVHHESMTRGRDDTPAKRARFRREKRLLRRLWAEELQRAAHHPPALSLLTEAPGLRPEW